MEKTYQQFNWDICGHEPIVNFLQSAIISERVAHAYLFVGPAGLGKFSVAKEFIKSLFCSQSGEISPCGKCHHCRQLKNGVHPDVYVVEKQVNEKTGKLKREIVIDQIRDLKSRLQQATLLNSYKVAIISEAQFINTEAANAILKILEEPTPKTVIILIADDADELPSTVASRCQVLKFLPVAKKEIEKYLGRSGVSMEETKKLSAMAVGRPGLALSFWQDNEKQIKYNKQTIDFLNLSISPLSKRFSFVADLIDWDKDDGVNIGSLKEMFSVWRSMLRDCLLFQSDSRQLMANMSSVIGIEKNQSVFSYFKIKKNLEAINSAEAYFDRNISAKNVLENLIIKL
ncbi:MAG: DNA polymerase III subunit delta' [bacterium]